MYCKFCLTNTAKGCSFNPKTNGGVIMTFEILITLYGLFLMFYMPYVLIKVIKMRREHDRQYREFMRRNTNA